MGNVHEQKRFRGKFTVSESNVIPPSVKKPFLFATELKVKSRDVQMYHIYGVTEIMCKTKKTINY